MYVVVRMINRVQVYSVRTRSTYDNRAHLSTCTGRLTQDPLGDGKFILLVTVVMFSLVSGIYSRKLRGPGALFLGRHGKLKAPNLNSDVPWR